MIDSFSSRSLTPTDPQSFELGVGIQAAMAGRFRNVGAAVGKSRVIGAEVRCPHDIDVWINAEHVILLKSCSGKPSGAFIAG